jgi:hypothetical protein
VKEEKKAMQQIMQSSRIKPNVIGVANRYALFVEKKKTVDKRKSLQGNLIITE